MNPALKTALDRLVSCRDAMLLAHYEEVFGEALQAWRDSEVRNSIRALREMVSKSESLGAAVETLDVILDQY